MSGSITLAFKSPEGVKLFALKGHRPEPLVALANRALGRLYKRAEGGQVYPWLALLEMAEELQQTDDYIKKGMALSDSRIARKIGQLPSVKSPVIQCQTIEVSTANHFTFARCIEQYDVLMNKMHLARVAKCYAHQNAYFRATGKVQKRLWRLMSFIAGYRTDLLPNITISDFLAKSERYQSTAATFGAINPDIFYLALVSTATPLVSPRRLAKLRKALEAWQLDNKTAVIEKEERAA